jgi:hypothetical protein
MPKNIETNYTLTRLMIVEKFSEYVAVNLAGVGGTLKTKWCKIPAF